MVDSNGDLRIHRSFDGFGDVVDETHYNASGVVVTAGQSGFVSITVGFTGRFLDEATGLQNNLNRWYDASIGRWISEDPISFLGGDTNLYCYVGNTPTMYLDAAGLLTVGIGIGFDVFLWPPIGHFQGSIDIQFGWGGGGGWPGAAGDGGKTSSPGIGALPREEVPASEAA